MRSGRRLRRLATLPRRVRGRTAISELGEDEAKILSEPKIDSIISDLARKA